MEASTKTEAKEKIKIVAVSDNHGDYKKLNSILAQKGDIFIHAGDFTYHSSDEDVLKFLKFLQKLNFKHKVVISGNHEIFLYRNLQPNNKSGINFTREKLLEEFKSRDIIYLEHESIIIEGIKIFGSPHTPLYCKKPKGRAFQYQGHNSEAIWSTVPMDTQLLITHGPPYGILDTSKSGKKAGCQSLKKKVEQVKPKYHVFGHIHEGKGMDKSKDTTFLNVAKEPTKFIM